MGDTGRYVDARYNKSLLTYTFANGSYIEFFSADQPDRLRGARRNVLYINEANNIDFDSYNELSIRTSGDIWLDFNPTAEFWAHTEVLTEPDSELLILTYIDNEALPSTTRQDIEAKRDKGKTSEYWRNWWTVYGLGQIGLLMGAVFDNWAQVDIIPEDAKLLGYGMDFGYTNDPTTLIGVYQLNGVYYFDELIYQKGMTNSDIAGMFKSVAHVHSIVIADSAEPKSITEISQYGIRIQGAEKGKDSVLYGINKLQQSKFYVTKRSVNLIKELRAYVWETDNTGRSLNKPIDAFNHCIDAIRYFVTTSDKGQGRYVFG